MNSTGLIVVGSGPAGVSAAEAFREHNSQDPVLILTDDPALPYARPPLSKEFLRGDADVDDAELHPAQWFDDRNIELVRTAKVDGIDRTQQHVMAGGRETLLVPLAGVGLRRQAITISGAGR
jgi:3-phenylpropionate/trans-cinnamate dioxygenase ferredoxin reductase component